MTASGNGSNPGAETPREQAFCADTILQPARLAMNNLELRLASSELAGAAANLKTLARPLPVCSWCKEVRAAAGYWQNVEAYIQMHTDTKITHSLCPKCSAKYFPEFPPEAKP